MQTARYVLGIAAVVAVVAVAIGWAHIAAWWRYGDVTPEQRIAAFERRLIGMRGGAMARLPDGAMAIVRRTDIASVGETTCRRESECWGKRCSYVYVRFHCGYRVRLRDGGDAVAYLLLIGKADIFTIASPPTFETDERRMDDAARELCTLGLGCSGEVRPAAAADDPGLRTFKDCKDGFCAPAMVALPRGSYRRGSTDEEIARLLVDEGRVGDARLFEAEQPAHEVQIGYPLAVGMFEVTVAEWGACVAEAACPSPGRSVKGEDQRNPVTGVSWIDVTQHYLPWLNRKLGLTGGAVYRLPTDAEWEYAARGGTTTRYPTGDLLTTRQARFYVSDPAPVGSYPPNRFGLHDMIGNVPEWVQDCISGAISYETAARDGSAQERSDCGSRIRRDAAWHSLPWYMRSASRTWSSPDERLRTGFRLARTVAD